MGKRERIRRERNQIQQALYVDRSSLSAIIRAQQIEKKKRKFSMYASIFYFSKQKNFLKN